VLEKFGSIRLKNKLAKTEIFRKLQYNLSILLGQFFALKRFDLKDQLA
jgi:hypothetical protein